MTTTYDEIPYPSYSFPDSHPEHLFILASLFGMKAAPIDKAAVFEIGCAAGTNLIPMAAQLKNAKFTGIDLSEKQIETGKNLIAKAGLKNIELACRNIMEIPDNFGTFDYIICHGVFSWVPPEVQDRILELCAKHLTPNGVAYISYNTLPGWNMYKSIRDMMLFHTRQFTEPRMIIQQARAFLDFAAANAGKQTPYSLLLRGELERLKVQSDAYLYHDHLEHNNIPVYFHEFMHHAGEKGLRYLADAAFHTMTPSEFGPEVQQTLRNLSDKIVGMEQYMDFLRNRSFRSTLLCRREVQLTRKIDVSSIQKFQFASALQPNPEPDPSMQPGLHSFKHPSGSELRTGESLMVAVLEYFAENWPTWKPLDHVVKGVREKVLKSAAATKPEVSDTTVGSFVLQLFQQGLVELHVIPPAFTTKVSTRPTASALARTQIKERLELTNLRHERVVLPDVFRHIASQCDGTKDKAQLAVLVEAAVKEGTLTMREGKALPEPGPERTKYLQNIVESALKYLSRAALLSA